MYNLLDLSRNQFHTQESAEGGIVELLIAEFSGLLDPIEANKMVHSKFDKVLKNSETVHSEDCSKLHFDTRKREVAVAVSEAHEFAYVAALPSFEQISHIFGNLLFLLHTLTRAQITSNQGTNLWLVWMPVQLATTSDNIGK